MDALMEGEPSELLEPLLRSVEEYFESVDVSVFLNGVKEFLTACPEFHHNEGMVGVVKLVVAMSVSRDEREREAVSRFLSAGSPLVLTSIEVGQAFLLLFQARSDMALQVPMVDRHLLAFLARAVVDEVLPPAFLTDPQLHSLGGDIVDGAVLLLSREGSAIRRLAAMNFDSAVESRRFDARARRARRLLDTTTAPDSFSFFSSLPDDMFIEISAFLDMFDRPRLRLVNRDFDNRIEQNSDAFFAKGLEHLCGPPWAVLTIRWPMNLELPYRKMFTAKKFYETICKGRYGEARKRSEKRSDGNLRTKFKTAKEVLWPLFSPLCLEMNPVQTNPWLSEELLACVLKVCPACMSADVARPDLQLPPYGTLGCMPFSETAYGRFMEENKLEPGNFGMEVSFDGVQIDDLYVFQQPDFLLKVLPGEHVIGLKCLNKCGFSGHFRFDLLRQCEDVDHDERVTAWKAKDCGATGEAEVDAHVAACEYCSGIICLICSSEHRGGCGICRRCGRSADHLNECDWCSMETCKDCGEGCNGCGNKYSCGTCTCLRCEGYGAFLRHQAEEEEERCVREAEWRMKWK